MLIRSALAVLAALTLCPAAHAAEAAPFAPCTDAGEAPELAGSLCARLSLPLDPSTHRAPGEVELFIRKFPVADATRRKGQVWLVAGGPGESGASFYGIIDTMRRAFPDRDLIIPDHRGTGYSTRLCPKEEAVDSPGGMALAGAEWGPCIGGLHADPVRAHAFSITNAAHDLSALMARLRGPGETHLYGVSYGTQLVLRMMQSAPVPLDGIILDGLVSPEGSRMADLGRRTEIVDAVGRSLLTPAQQATYRKVLDGPPIWKDLLGEADLRQVMGSLLNYPALRDRIPALVEALSQGETAPLAETVNALQAESTHFARFAQSPSSLPLVAVISGSENNERRTLTAETVSEEAADALFISPLPGLLAGNGFPLYQRDGHFGELPTGLPPTLVVQGTLDPNTPYEGAVRAITALEGRGEIALATVDRGAHFLALMAPDCFARATRAFLAEEPVPSHCAS